MNTKLYVAIELLLHNSTSVVADYPSSETEDEEQEEEEKDIDSENEDKVCMISFHSGYQPFGAYSVGVDT